MQPGKIEGATRELGAPSNWDAHKDGECASLWVRPGLINDSYVMQSAWIPSEEEKQHIAAGHAIILTMWSTAHPPVAIDVQAAP